MSFDLLEFDLMFHLLNAFQIVVNKMTFSNLFCFITDMPDNI